MSAFYQPVPHDLLYLKVGGPPDDWRDVHVYLDGVPVPEAREANVLQGWVEEYLYEPDGSAVVRDGQYVTRRRHGIVVCRRENG